MNILPFDKFDIITENSLWTIYDKLFKVVEKDKYNFLCEDYDKPYHGYIYEKGFTIKPTSYIRNSFVPLIKGSFHNKDNKSVIHIKMKLDLPVLIFMIAWVMGLLFILTILVVSWILDSASFESDPKDAFIGISVMISFGIIVPTIIYKIGALNAKKDLIELFKN